MHRFKKFTAYALSAAMMMGSSMTALAADPTTSAGTGNILDYKVQTQIVPTAISLAINPNGYAVNVRYTAVAEDAEYAEGTKYYSKGSDGKYSIVTDIIASGTGANWDDKVAAGLYTATTSNSQLVTFNYGLANTSTVDRKITVSFEVSADESITFVDTAAKATNEAAEDDGGAKKGEYKIFLQLVPAKAGEAITASTYAEATGDFDEDAEYYTKSGNDYTLVEENDEDAFDDGDYYVATTTIGTLIQAKELADVNMTASTAPVAFSTGSGTTSAEVAFSLPKATYSLKDDEFIDFSTTTAQVAGKFEMTGIGGVSGFTFTGVMNTNTEWAELETKTITITPTYRFEDSTGLETAVSTGLNQVAATPAGPSVTLSASGLITVSNLTAEKNYASSTVIAYGSESYELNSDGNITWGTNSWSASEGGTLTIQLNDVWLGVIEGEEVTVTVTLSDGSTITATQEF
jgi:hypothetical protein